MESEMQALRAAGLTEYQARSYVALLTLGSGTAEQTAEAAGVPRTRVYRVLRDLESKGWVEGDKGRPRLFRARDPRGCLERARQETEAALEQALPRLEARYQARTQRFAGSLWVLEGRNGILERMVRMVQQASDRVTVAGPPDLTLDPEVVDALQRAARRGVRARLATAAVSDAAGRRLRESGVRVQETPTPINLVLVDDRQSLLLFPTRGQTPRAIWNPNPELVAIVEDALPVMLGLDGPEKTGDESGPTDD